jgi:tRNA threonylcarbamoyladenosine biosynthesis protein TsaE
MTTPTCHRLTTLNAAQTRCLGACLGKRLQGGEVIRIQGMLGAGKTCFVKGLARGLDVPPTYEITSPTYTLINDYPARLPFFHVDLYRIASSVDADGIGLWDLFAENAVVAVEWADRLEDREWPKESLRLSLCVLDDHRRQVDLIGCGLRYHVLIKQVVADYAVECSNSLK